MILIAPTFLSLVLVAGRTTSQYVPQNRCDSISSSGAAREILPTATFCSNVVFYPAFPTSPFAQPPSTTTIFTQTSPLLKYSASIIPELNTNDIQTTMNISHKFVTSKLQATSLPVINNQSIATALSPSSDSFPSVPILAHKTFVFCTTITITEQNRTTLGSKTPVIGHPTNPIKSFLNIPTFTGVLMNPSATLPFSDLHMQSSTFTGITFTSPEYPPGAPVSLIATLPFSDSHVQPLTSLGCDKSPATIQVTMTLPPVTETVNVTVMLSDPHKSSTSPASTASVEAALTFSDSVPSTAHGISRKTFLQTSFPGERSSAIQTSIATIIQTSILPNNETTVATIIQTSILPGNETSVTTVIQTSIFPDSKISVATLIQTSIRPEIKTPANIIETLILPDRETSVSTIQRSISPDGEITATPPTSLDIESQITTPSSMSNIGGVTSSRKGIPTPIPSISISIISLQPMTVLSTSSSSNPTLISASSITTSKGKGSSSKLGSFNKRRQIVLIFISILICFYL